LSKVRQFDSGANRDVDDDKYDYAGFFDPAVLTAFSAYMHSCRQLPDGSMRSGGNWKNGIPLDSYVSSMLRHVMDLWMIHEGHEATRPESGEQVTIADALGGIMFNCQGYWSETLKTQ
jgi:hypothetical protein